MFWVYKYKHKVKPEFEISLSTFKRYLKAIPTKKKPVIFADEDEKDLL